LTEKKKQTFEEAMEELETIVHHLEEGEVPLEKALHYYQKGIELSKFCHDTLKNAEDKLTKLITDNGEEEFSLKEEDTK
jgi:exodeoxyribonuclease VII small subunit